jgi:hypothetical protein
VLTFWSDYGNHAARFEDQGIVPLKCSLVLSTKPQYVHELVMCACITLDEFKTVVTYSGAIANAAGPGVQRSDVLLVTVQ